MVETSRLGRVATWCYDRRRRVVTVWVLVLIAVSIAGRAGGSDFKDKLLGGDSESEHARTLLARSFPTQAGDVAQVVFRADAASGAAGAQATIGTTVTELRGVRHVAAVRGPFDGGVSGQVSPDGHSAYAVVQFDNTADELPASDVDHVIAVARSHQGPGLTVELGGAPIAAVDKAAPGASEGIGILAAIAILLVAFGSVIAMGLPILTALFGIAIAFGVLD